MIKFEKSIVIDAPVEDVFAYTADPKHLVDFWTGISEVTDVKRLPNGGYSFKFVIKQAGMRFDVAAEYVEFVPSQRAVLKTHAPGRESMLSLAFERIDGGKTRVRMVHEYVTLSVLAGKLDEAFLARMLEHANELTLESLKAHMELSIAAAPAR